MRAKFQANIRGATTGDYPAIAEMMTIQRPDFPRNAENLQYDHAHRPDHCKHQFFIAEHENQAIGFALYTQHADLFKEGEFHVNVFVREDFRRKGVGWSLYDAMYRALVQFEPQMLRSRVSEDNIDGFIFASKRAFMERSRRIESRLNIATANLDSLSERLEKLSAQGIEIRSYADCSDDPERDQKFYTIHTTIDVDIPMETPVVPLPYEQWKANVIEHPQFLADGSFIAIHEGQYVGISSQFRFIEDMVYVELTGTLADYRRKGISTALKLCGIRYAKEQNIPRVGTTNDAVNEGILAINKNLGFVPQPAIIHLGLKI